PRMVHAGCGSSASARGAGGRPDSMLGQHRRSPRRQDAGAQSRYTFGRRDHSQRLLRPEFQGQTAMKLHYYSETDSLYIELKPTPGTQTREVADGLVVDLDAAGQVVGFDIDRASQRFDLSSLERVALPVRTTSAA